MTIYDSLIRSSEPFANIEQKIYIIMKHLVDISGLDAGVIAAEPTPAAEDVCPEVAGLASAWSDDCRAQRVLCGAICELLIGLDEFGKIESFVDFDTGNVAVLEGSAHKTNCKCLWEGMEVILLFR